MAAVASLHPQHGMVSELRHVFIPSESLYIRKTPMAGR